MRELQIELALLRRGRDEFERTQRYISEGSRKKVVH